MDKLHYLNYLEDFITQERKDKFNQIISNRTNHFTVALEDLFQMHNTSAVIRSCDVFGIQNAHIIEKRFKNKIDKNISVGAQKWVNQNFHATTTSCIQYLKNAGYQIVATTPHQNAVTLSNFDITPKSAFFFGTERHGLSQEVFDQADVFLKIPMFGFSESLNISVCAAIILQNLTQKLHDSNINWHLSQDEITDIKTHWTITSIRNVNYIIDRYKQLKLKTKCTI